MRKWFIAAIAVLLFAAGAYAQSGGQFAAAFKLLVFPNWTMASRPLGGMPGTVGFNTQTNSPEYLDGNGVWTGFGGAGAVGPPGPAGPAGPAGATGPAGPAGSGTGSGGGTVTSVSAGCGATATGGSITIAGTILGQVIENHQTVANYQISPTDCGKIIYLDNAAAQAPTIPVSSSTGFTTGWGTRICNIGAGVQTLTPLSGTIGGVANKVLAAGTRAAPMCVSIFAQSSLGATDYGIF